MGKAVFPMGSHGMGSAMKMVNNIILGQAMTAFSEALAIRNGMAEEDYGSVQGAGS